MSEREYLVMIFWMVVILASLYLYFLFTFNDAETRGFFMGISFVFVFYMANKIYEENKERS